MFLYVQLYRLNEEGQIGTGEWCLKSENGDTIHIRRCDVQPTGPWKWDDVSTAPPQPHPPTHSGAVIAHQ